MLNRFLKRALVATAAVGSLSAFLTAAYADNFPSKPSTIVSPFAAGGTNDYLSRAMARKLDTQLGKTFIVENRTGANGLIGANYVAQQKGNPYFMLMGNGASHGSNVTLQPKMPYDAINDFEPIGMVGAVPVVLIASSQIPVKNLKELAEWAKANPGKLSFGSSGNGGTGHITGETFRKISGIDMVHVPYKGDAPAASDVLGGQVPLAFVGAPSAIPHAKSGRIRILAVANATRSAVLPDVPTFAEAGYSGVEFSQWYALMAPAGIPKDVVNRLNEEVVKAVKSPDMQAAFASQSADPITSTPEELGAFIKSEIAKYAKAIKELGITAN